MYTLIPIEHLDGSVSYGILRDLDGVISQIPVDEANTDYQQYLIDTDGGLPLPKSKDK